MHVVDGGWVVYMGGYSIAPESLRARKSCVFVKQQKLRKRKGAWKERETEVKIENSTFRSLWGSKSRKEKTCIKTKVNLGRS